MKKQLLMGSLAAAILMANAGSALAEDAGAGFDVSANVGVVSDYVWRGVSQSNNEAAIQGGLDLKHSSGVYTGLWMSSLSGWYSPGSNYATTEQDLYVGYGMNITKDIAFDVRYTAFTYGDVQSDTAFDEWHLAASGYGATVGVDYAGNDSVGNSTTVNYYGSYSYSLPMDIGLSATYGEYDLKDAYYSNNSKYAYWTVGVSKKAAGITWGLSYNNTDLSGSECQSVSGSITNTSGDAYNACGEQLILSATKAL